MYSYGPPHMAGQKQDDQLEHISSSYVRIQDVAMKTCQRRWTIGRSGERGSGISVPVARHDDDDEAGLLIIHWVGVIQNFSSVRNWSMWLSLLFRRRRWAFLTEDSARSFPCWSAWMITVLWLGETWTLICIQVTASLTCRRTYASNDPSLQLNMSEYSVSYCFHADLSLWELIK